MNRVAMAESFARDILDEFPEAKVYHNVRHVENVVRVASELAVDLGFDTQDIELLQIAAWFHDLGHREGLSGHEERAVALVEEVMNECLSEPELKTVQSMILATEWPQEPDTRLEEVLCDADVHSLGGPPAVFEKKSEEIYRELKETEYPDLDRETLFEARIEMFEGFEYHTPVGRERFQTQFEQNLESMKEGWG